MAEEHTFQMVFEQWFEFRKLSLKAGHQSTREQIQRIFNKDILPTLGQQSVYDIKRFDLLEVIERVERRGALITAEKCRTWFHQLFRYALVKVPGLEQSPASDLDVVAIPKPLRGQRIPGWQLDPLRHQLTCKVLAKARDIDPWRVYGALITSTRQLGEQSPIEAVTLHGVEKAAMGVCRMLAR